MPAGFKQLASVDYSVRTNCVAVRETGRLHSECLRDKEKIEDGSACEG